MQEPIDPFMIRILETDGDVVELIATTSKGDLTAITSMSLVADTLVLSGLHVSGPGAGSLGLRELRRLATELGRQHRAKRVTILGGRRTTGANPGHTPRSITFLVGDE
ncbi:MAG TPA: hypothetical protein VG406_13965 [Isosphaeraceae bacterium]|nr:hypothetical protein [Isosphaeraceae bacterium]